MNVLTVILIGVVLGALDGVGIFLNQRSHTNGRSSARPHKKGVMVALLTGFSLAPTTRWWSAMAIGALYGLLFGLVIYLAKGGPTSGDAPYVIPSGIITGALIGLLIVIWAIKAI